MIRGGLDPKGIDLVLSVVALALLLPVLIFIGTATRLSAARREQRFAAMRLVGATPRQVSLIAAVESAVAAAVGVAIGFGLFFVLRIPLAAIPFTGQPFFPAELSLSLPDILVVAVGVPAAAAVAARLALRRVNISPLGVTRRVTPAPPRAWRVLPLLAGLADLGFFVVHGQPAEPCRAGPGVRARLRADHGRPGHRGAVADDGGGPGHGPAGQPPRRADRRAAAGRRSAGRVPGGQRPGPGAVHLHRGRRAARHAGHQALRGASTARRPTTSSSTSSRTSPRSAARQPSSGGIRAASARSGAGAAAADLRRPGHRRGPG